MPRLPHLDISLRLRDGRPGDAPVDRCHCGSRARGDALCRVNRRRLWQRPEAARRRAACQHAGTDSTSDAGVEANALDASRSEEAEEADAQEAVFEGCAAALPNIMRHGAFGEGEDKSKLKLDEAPPDRQAMKRAS